MNVVLLAEVSAVSVIGGAERVLQEQALGLRRRGHDVRLVVRAPAGDERPMAMLGDMPEYRYPVSRTNEWAFVVRSLAGSVGAFDRAAAPGDTAGAPSVAVVHQSMAGFGPIMRRRRAMNGWVYICHSLAHEEFKSRTVPGATWVERIRWRLNERMRYRVEHLVMRRCAGIVVLSEFMKTRVRQVHGIRESRIHVIPGAVDVQHFAPADDRGAVRSALGLPRERTILFTVRNLVPRMGLDKLIRAAADVRDAHKDVLLLIGGDGRLRGELQRQIDEANVQEAVRLIGFVGEDDLPRYYQAADLVLMPTHELEGFGLVTVEALACGTPVVGTPVGAIPEILTRIDPRLLAEGSEAEDLSAAIDRTLIRFRQEPQARARTAARAREVVLAEYRWDINVARLEAVIRQTAEGRQRKAEGG